jgi:hypothetical protein
LGAKISLWAAFRSSGARTQFAEFAPSGSRHAPNPLDPANVKLPLALGVRGLMLWLWVIGLAHLILALWDAA